MESLDAVLNLPDCVRIYKTKFLYLRITNQTSALVRALTNHSLTYHKPKIKFSSLFIKLLHPESRITNAQTTVAQKPHIAVRQERDVIVPALIFCFFCIKTKENKKKNDLENKMPKL